MALGDVKPFPQYGVAYELTFLILDTMGNPVANAQNVEGVMIKDLSGVIAPITNAVSYAGLGNYNVTLTAAEMQARILNLEFTSSTEDTIPTPIELRPEQPGDIRVKTMILDTTAIDQIWDEIAAEHPTAGSVAALLLKLNDGSVKLQSQVSGLVEPTQLTIMRGDSYLVQDGRALQWTDTGNAWPDLTGATVHFILGTPTLIQKTAIVHVASGTNKRFSVELTMAETQQMIQHGYLFAIKAVWDGVRVQTILRGSATILAI